METFRNIFDPIWASIFELWRITVIEISRMSIKCYLTVRWKLRRSEANLNWRIEFFRLTTVTMMAGEMTWTSVWGTLGSPTKTCEVIENLPWWVAGSLDRSRSKFHLVANNLTKIPHTSRDGNWNRKIAFRARPSYPTWTFDFLLIVRAH